MLADEKVEEGEFVDVIVQVYVSVAGHGGEGFLGNTPDLLFSKSSNIKKCCVE